MDGEFEEGVSCRGRLLWLLLLLLLLLLIEASSWLGCWDLLLVLCIEVLGDARAFASAFV